MTFDLKPVKNDLYLESNIIEVGQVVPEICHFRRVTAAILDFEPYRSYPNKVCEEFLNMSFNAIKYYVFYKPPSRIMAHYKSHDLCLLSKYMLQNLFASC